MEEALSCLLQGDWEAVFQRPGQGRERELVTHGVPGRVAVLQTKAQVSVMSEVVC